LRLAISNQLAQVVSRRLKSKSRQGEETRVIAPTSLPERILACTAVCYWTEKDMAGEKLRILIVDDDRQMVRTLCDIFRLNGYEAEEAHSGSEAMDKVNGGRYHCILSDIRMPGMTGIELCRAINAAHPGLPVLLMTAYSDQLVEARSVESAIATLFKPLDMELLLSLFLWVAQSFSVRAHALTGE